MPKAPSAEFEAQTSGTDEFEEVVGRDFPPIHNFNDNDTLIGRYMSTKSVNAKGKERTLHTFVVDEDAPLYDEDHDGEVQAWGAAILDSRLEDVDTGSRVKIVRDGKTTSKSGNQPWNFKVYIARSALR